MRITIASRNWAGRWSIFTRLACAAFHVLWFGRVTLTFKGLDDQTTHPADTERAQ